MLLVGMPLLLANFGLAYVAMVGVLVVIFGVGRTINTQGVGEPASTEA